MIGGIIIAFLDMSFLKWTWSAFICK